PYNRWRGRNHAKIATTTQMPRKLQTKIQMSRSLNSTVSGPYITTAMRMPRYNSARKEKDSGVFTSAALKSCTSRRVISHHFGPGSMRSQHIRRWRSAPGGEVRLDSPPPPCCDVDEVRPALDTQAGVRSRAFSFTLSRPELGKDRDVDGEGE